MISAGGVPGGDHAVVEPHRPLEGGGAVGAVVLLGLVAAMVLRLAVGGLARPGSTVASTAFAASLAAVAVAAGWRPGVPRLSGVAWGLLGGAVICVPPLVDRLAGWSPALGPAAPELLAGWASVTAAVAVAEEVLLRGALFSAVSSRCGPGAAVVVAAVAFALLHVPLYGWGAVPLDLAVGVWLGGLRLASGGVAAPATAHSLADLATWWLR